jgi:hypothetical protein
MPLRGVGRPCKYPNCRPFWGAETIAENRVTPRCGFPMHVQHLQPGEPGVFPTRRDKVAPCEGGIVKYINPGLSLGYAFMAFQAAELPIRSTSIEVICCGAREASRDGLPTVGKASRLVSGATAQIGVLRVPPPPCPKHRTSPIYRQHRCLPRRSFVC